MRVVLVGRRGDKRVILWGNFLKTGFILILLSGALTTLAYVTLAQRWNPAVPIRGLLGGLGIAVILLVVGLLTPLKQLPFLPRRH
jgi:hypothetical protein